MNVMSSLLRQETRDDDEPLNILSFATHERYQQMFGLTPHNFYLYRGPGLKEWDFKYAKLPANTTILNGVGEDQQIPKDVEFDLILSQNKFGQFAIAKRLSDSYQIPLLSLEHTLPHPQWSKGTLNMLRGLRGHTNVFLSEYSRDAWGWDGDYTIVEPGIDSDTFKPLPGNYRKPYILSVVNDWINRDVFCGFKLWKNVSRDLPVKVLGNTPGLSKAAESTGELVSAYQDAQVFLNTSQVSTMPFTVLESMACLPAGEVVFFNYTPTPIEEVCNMQTLNENLRGDKILAKMCRDYDGDIHTIKTRYLPSFKLTSEHPVKVAVVGQVYDPEAKRQRRHSWKRVVLEEIWKDAKDVKVGDWLITPKETKTIPLGFSREWMRFYGLFVAEGCIVNGQIQLTFHEDETEFIEEVRHIASLVNRKITVTKVGDEKAVRVVFIHAGLARQLGDMFHKLSHNKNIPPEFFFATKEEIKWFLEGYWDGDGHKIDEHTKTIVTTSQSLAYQLVLLLNTINEMPSIVFSGPREGIIRGRKFQGRGRYQVTWTTSHTNRKRYYIEDKNNFYLPVTKVSSENYKGKVYNFTTESHTFQVPFIQTHNCGMAVVSTATTMIPQVIEDGINGFCSNDPAVLRRRCEELLADRELREKIGVAARTTIENRFNFGRMAKDWDKTLRETSRILVSC